MRVGIRKLARNLHSQNVTFRKEPHDSQIRTPRFLHIGQTVHAGLADIDYRFKHGGGVVFLRMAAHN
jgi:hypothetical protein